MLLNPHTGEIRLDHTDTHLVFTAEAFTWIESVLKVGTMDILRKTASMDLSMTETQVILTSGMEAWRRRNGNQGKPITPAKALRMIDQTGGLLVAIGQIAESFDHCPSLGLTKVKDEDVEEDQAVDPTTGDESSPVSSVPAFLLAQPGN